MDRLDLIRILHGDVQHLFNLNVEHIITHGITVVVYPKDVKHMLLQFLENKISAEDLRRWSRYIYMGAGEEYIDPRYSSDDNETEDYYDEMWGVLACLTVPAVNGAITHERVKQYLSELSKYDDNQFKTSTKNIT